MRGPHYSAFLLLVSWCFGGDAMVDKKGVEDDISIRMESWNQLGSLRQQIHKIASEREYQKNLNPGSVLIPIEGPKRGPQGSKGIPGIKGLKGKLGDKGYKGMKGLPGSKGVKGEKGVNGSPGKKGSRGDPGMSGQPGEKGSKGYKGFKGIKALKAIKGRKGARGSKGEKANKGPKGSRGLQGIIGQVGSQGAPGEFASNGIGPPGIPGSPGEIGAGGYKGYKGSDGTKGVKGFKGFKGSDGDTKDGDLGSSGSQGSIGTKGESIPLTKGQKGEKGILGSQGNAGTNGRLIKGRDGPPGSVGSQGTTGPQGPVGSVGSVGPKGFKGYKGIRMPGERGSPGEKGTLNRGSQGGPGGTPSMPGTEGMKGLKGLKGIKGIMSMMKGEKGQMGMPGYSGRCDINGVASPSRPGVCYYLSLSALSFSNADTACGPGYLAAVTTEEENSALLAWLKSYEIPEAWIGLKDAMGDNTYEWTNIDVFFIQGMSYDDWSSGEPTPGGCTGIRSDGWSTDACSNYKPYFCEGKEIADDYLFGMLSGSVRALKNIKDFLYGRRDRLFGSGKQETVFPVFDGQTFFKEQRELENRLDVAAGKVDDNHAIINDLSSASLVNAEVIKNIHRQIMLLRGDIVDFKEAVDGMEFVKQRRRGETPRQKLWWWW